MLFGGRAPPGPARGAYSAPPDPVAALKLLAPSALGDRAFRFLFPIRKLSTEATRRHGFALQLPLPVIVNVVSLFLVCQSSCSHKHKANIEHGGVTRVASQASLQSEL